MIVLATTATSMPGRAADLQRTTGERVQVLDPRRMHEHRAEMEDAALLVLDEAFVESSPALAEEAIAQAGRASLLELNFAVCGAERMRREIKRALQWRHREQLVALQNAREALSSELKSLVTGIHLAAQMTQELPGVGDDLRARLGTLRALTAELESRLTSPPQPQVRPGGVRARAAR